MSDRRETLRSFQRQQRPLPGSRQMRARVRARKRRKPPSKFDNARTKTAAARYYQTTWDAVQDIRAGELAKAGLLVESAEFEIRVPGWQRKFVFRCDGQALEARFAWCDERTGEVVVGCNRLWLEPKPCRFGGARMFLSCPGCGAHRLRFALLPTGVRCGPCGKVQQPARRLDKTGRLARKARKLADRLELASWDDAPAAKPLNMPWPAFERLAYAHERAAEIAGQAVEEKAARFREASHSARAMVHAANTYEKYGI